jgi:hypothetical protein
VVARPTEGEAARERHRLGGAGQPVSSGRRRGRGGGRAARRRARLGLAVVEGGGGSTGGGAGARGWRGRKGRGGGRLVRQLRASSHVQGMPLARAGSPISPRPTQHPVGSARNSTRRLPISRHTAARRPRSLTAASLLLPRPHRQRRRRVWPSSTNSSDLSSVFVSLLPSTMQCALEIAWI